MVIGLGVYTPSLLPNRRKKPGHCQLGPEPENSSHMYRFWIEENTDMTGLKQFWQDHFPHSSGKGDIATYPELAGP